MRAYEFLTEGRDAPLYHGINKVKYAIEALKNNRLAATTTQRFCPDGKRRIQQGHDDQEYENSYWMKGLSLTRDINMACKWGSVIFILDQAKLAQRYKFTPLNWMYSIKNSVSRKQEREEFLVVKAIPDNYHDQVDEDDPTFKQFNYNRFKSVEGYVENLNKYLLGIYVSNDFLERYDSEYLSEEDKNLILKHPKFLGYVDTELHRKKWSQSQIKIKEGMLTETFNGFIEPKEYYSKYDCFVLLDNVRQFINNLENIISIYVSLREKQHKLSSGTSELVLDIKHILEEIPKIKHSLNLFNETKNIKAYNVIIEFLEDLKLIFLNNMKILKSEIKNKKFGQFNSEMISLYKLIQQIDVNIDILINRINIIKYE